MHTIRWLPCLASLALAAFTPLRAQEPEAGDAPDKVPSDFIRFVKVADGGHLDTAITTYTKGDVEVRLFAAVHIADKACYEALNDRFTNCDALLYELVGPENYRPKKDAERGTSLISMLQQGLKNSLELTFQLDEIDYSPANFVHADMTPDEFQASMDERGESLLSIMLNMMLSGMQTQQQKAEAGEQGPGETFDLVTAFRNGEGRHQMRMAFAGQLEEIEMMSSGGQAGGTLLQGRNEKCLQVLERELAAGKQKVGIYYGGAHLPHMEQRLVQDMGFHKTAHEWLVAWDCTKRPDIKYDRALIKQRQQCKEELRQLAAAVRTFRLQQTPGEFVTPSQLAAARKDGAPLYSGPEHDPWGRDYVLRKRPTGARWEAVSLGQDGKPGTDDDMVAQEPRGS